MSKWRKDWSKRAKEVIRLAIGYIPSIDGGLEEAHNLLDEYETHRAEIDAVRRG